MKNKTLLLLCAFAALGLGGCFKSLSYDTVYVIRPSVQVENKGATTSLPGVKAYAFAADTTNWMVASYEDALAGIITSKKNPQERITTPIAVTGPFPPSDTIPASVDWIQMRLEESSAMIVVVDTQHEHLYAYRQQNFSENLSPIYVPVTFQVWRSVYRYTVGPWRYMNDFYAPERPQSYEMVLKPSMQAAEADESAPLTGIGAYAYAVDTSAWKIASYEDAAAGIITSKSDPEQQKTAPDYTAVADGSEGWLRLESGQMTLMVVAVDAERKVYAYSKQELTWYEAYQVELVFRPWRQTYLYVEGPWRVVDEALKPAEPENPDNPDDPENPDNPENPDTPQTQNNRKI